MLRLLLVLVAALAGTALGAIDTSSAKQCGTKVFARGIGTLSYDDATGEALAASIPQCSGGSIAFPGTSSEYECYKTLPTGDTVWFGMKRKVSGGPFYRDCANGCSDPAHDDLVCTSTYPCLWASGEPNNVGGTENCAFMNLIPGHMYFEVYEFNDIPCGGPYSWAVQFDNCDIVPPTVAMELPLRHFNSSTIALAGTQSDNFAAEPQVTVTIAGATFSAAETSGSWSSSPSGLTDGQYNVGVTATDAHGNSASQTYPLAVVVDLTPPVVHFTQDGAIVQTITGFTFSGQVTERWEVSDGLLRLYYPGGPPSSLSVGLGVSRVSTFQHEWSYTHSGATVADHDAWVVHVRMRDEAGNPGIGMFSLIVDSTQPVLFQPDQLLTSLGSPIVGTVDDGMYGDPAVELELRVDGRSVPITNHLDGTWSATLPVGLFQEGIYSSVVSGRDWAENVGTFAQSDGLVFDASKPVLSFRSKITALGAFPISGTVLELDPTPSMTVMLADVSGGTPLSFVPAIAANPGAGEKRAQGRLRTWTVSVPMTTPDGYYDVTVVASDWAGHADSATYLAGLIIDRIPPVVAWVPAMYDIPRPVLSGTIVDADPRVRVYIQLGSLSRLETVVDANAGTWTYALDFDLADGTYDVAFYAVDVAANEHSPIYAASLVIDTSPVARNDTAGMTSEEEPILSIEAVTNDFSPIGSALRITSVVSYGVCTDVAVSADGLSFAYDPRSAFDHLRLGEHATDAFSYQVRDARGHESNVAWVTVTVTGVNDAPRVEPQPFAVAAGSVAGAVVVEGSLFTVPGNVTFVDPDNASHDATLYWGDSADSTLVPTVAQGGGLFVAQSAGASHVFAQDGSYELLLQIQETDGSAQAEFLSDHVTVLNAQPVITEPSPVGTFTVEERRAVRLGNVSFTDAGALDVHYAGVFWLPFFAPDAEPESVPVDQALRVAVSGAIAHSYDRSGLYEPVVRVCDGFPAVPLQDGSVLCADARFLVNVTNVPEPQDDWAGLLEGEAISLPDVLDNDGDPYTGAIPELYGFDTVSQRGASISLDSNGILRYDTSDSAFLTSLSQDEVEVDMFQYSVIDEGVGSATVRVQVVGVNARPEAVDDGAQAVRDGADVAALDAWEVAAGAALVTPSVLENDRDSDRSDRISLVAVDPVTQWGAHVTLVGDGVLRVQTSASGALKELHVDQAVVDAFNYTIADQHGAEASAQVHVVVYGTKPIPVEPPGGNATAGDGGVILDTVPVRPPVLPPPSVAQLPVIDNGNGDFDILDPDTGEVITTVSFDNQPVGGNSGIELTATLVDPSTRPPAFLFSTVAVDLKLRRGESDISQLDGDAEVCFNTNSAFEKDRSCLSFFDERDNRWRCEDPCLQSKKGMQCAKTSHFTNFAVLLTGTGANKKCGPEGNQWFTGSGTWDAVVVGLCFAFVCCIGFCFVVADRFDVVHKHVHGEEGHRVVKTREKMESLTLDFDERGFDDDRVD